MVIKKLIVAVAAFSLAACAVTGNKQSQEKTYFQDYALAVCFGSAFDSAQVKSDFNKTANGIMERGNMPLEAYEELRDLVSVWLRKDYSSKDGGQVSSAKCIDLHHSQDIDELFEKYNPCNAKNDVLSSETLEKNCRT